MNKSLAGSVLITILLSIFIFAAPISTVKAQNNELTILQPEDKSYNSSDVPLTISADQPVRLWASLNGYNFSITANTTLQNLQNGNYTLTVFNSNAGHIISQTVRFTVNSPEAAATPKVKILSPTNQTYNTTRIDLKFTVEPQAYWAVYSVDGKQNVTAISGMTLLLARGTHHVTVYASTIAGAPAGYDTATFNVNADWSQMMPPNLNSTGTYNETVGPIVQATFEALTGFVITAAVIFAVAVGILVVFLVLMIRKGSKQDKQKRMVR